MITKRPFWRNIIWIDNLHDYETWLQNYEPVANSETLVDGDQIALSGALQNESSEDRKERKRIAAEKRKKLSPLKKQLSQAENIMSKAQEQLVVLEDKLADADLYLHENKEKLKSLLDEQAKQKQILEDTELQWFELSEEIEDAEQAED